MRLSHYITKRIKGSEFLRNTFQLVIGTGIAQMITILISPVITRLYSPEAFGSFSFFIAVVGAFVLIATLRYEVAIVFPPEEKEAVNIAVISGIIAFVFSLVLLAGVLLLWFFYPPYRAIEPFLRHGLFLLPLMVLFLSVSNIIQNWLVRQKRFRTISISKVINSFANNGLILLFGLAGAGVWGLVFGNFIGLILFLSYLVYRLFVEDKPKAKLYDRSSLKTLARRYRDLPTSNTFQALLELVQASGIIYLSRIFFTSATVGLYALSLRILQAPLWLIGSSISQVYMKEAAEKVNKSVPLRPTLINTLKLGVLTALPILIGLLVAGPWLFSVVFGENWREAGVYARILSPWMFFDFLRYCVSQTPLLIGKTRAMMRISMLGSATLVLSFIAGNFFFIDVRTVFLLLSFMMSIYALGVVIWILKIVGDFHPIKPNAG
ncbi:MAG TPA: oligosaccharide flippase family protein [Bacteroidales bacterium]|nr:oligosaccharide flippase family protein [Bacteroidales bacterium]